MLWLSSVPKILITEGVRQQLSIAVTLSILLGLGWGIGLLATQDIHTNKIVRDLFAALFVIITAFHGLLIFIMHCLCSKEVRNTWKWRFYGATGKDFNALALSAISNKFKKPVPDTIPSTHQVGESVSETTRSMKIESKIEGVMSAETTFTKRKWWKLKTRKRISHTVCLSYCRIYK